MKKFPSLQIEVLLILERLLLRGNGFFSDGHIIDIKVYISFFRSNYQRCSMKKGILRTFAKFTGKHICQSLFFNKVPGLSSATLLKKRLMYRCFPVNFLKFLRTPFLQNTSGRMLLFLINAFYAGGLFLYSRETVENQSFSGAFKGG